MKYIKLFEMFSDINHDMIQDAMRGKYDKFIDYVNNGADINAVDNNGFTALIWVSKSSSFPGEQEGRIKILKYLLDKNAALDTQGFKCKDTAISTAAYAGTLEAVKLLVDAGANLNLKDCFNMIPFDIAKSEGHMEAALYILKKMLENEPQIAYKYVEYLTPEQKEEYKEYIRSGKTNLWDLK